MSGFWFDLGTAAAVYVVLFAPAIVAFLREDRNRGIIAVLNIALWFFHWWVIPQLISLASQNTLLLTRSLELLYWTLWGILLIWSVFGRRLTELQP